MNHTLTDVHTVLPFCKRYRFQVLMHSHPIYGLYYVKQTVGSCIVPVPLSGAVRRRGNRVFPLLRTLHGTPAEQTACPLIFHVTPTPVYAGWSKVNIRWIAEPLV